MMLGCRVGGAWASPSEEGRQGILPPRSYITRLGLARAARG